MTGKIFLKPKNRFLSDRLFAKCDSCIKPDIYLILADEYAGRDELKNIFHYDNLGFENELKNRGFHITPGSYSNYNYTSFSMASFMNMDYLKNIKLIYKNHKSMIHCLEMINDNMAGNFFKKIGYDIINNSLFSFSHKAAKSKSSFIKNDISLVTSHTFTSRIQRDIAFNFLSFSADQRKKKFRLQKEVQLKTTSEYNNLMLENLNTAINISSSKPRFIYTHLFMPHYPYNFKETGEKNSFEILENEYNQTAYINYLAYSNTIFLQLIDTILHRSPKPPIIILLSDHGFKEFKTQVDPVFYFMNVNAVYLPNRKYNQFYNGMSNVNLFRAILNSEFGQHLPLLKDTAFFMKEKNIE